MRVGILISEEQYASSAMPERLEAAAQELGHQAVRMYEPSLTLSPPLSPSPHFPSVVIVRPNFIEEPSHHQALYDFLKVSGCKLINGEVLRTKNKLLQRHDLVSAGIPMPRWGIASAIYELTAIAEDIGYPVMIKAPFGTKGKGVFFAPSREVFRPIVDYLNVRDKNPLIIEEYIVEAKNADIRAFVVGDEVVASMEYTAPAGEVRSNAGGTGATVELTDEERALAIKATRVMNLDIAGVDILRSNRGPLVMEVNANPGFKELERVTGIDVAKKIIEFALK